MKYKVRDLLHNNNTTTTASTNATFISSKNSSNSRCVYTGISMGIKEYSNLLKNNRQLLNKKRYEYENDNHNDHNDHYVFTVENLHSSHISLHRILGNQNINVSYVYSVLYVYTVLLIVVCLCFILS